MLKIILITILCNASFIFFLNKKINGNVLLEVGFLISIFLSSYIIFPALFIEFNEYNTGDPISYVINDFIVSNSDSIANNFYRLILYLSVFQCSYLLFRNRSGVKLNMTEENYDFLLKFAVSLLVFSYFVLLIFARDFDGYVDSYRKYDHLSSSMRILISVVTRLKSGLLPLTLFLIFSKFRERKILILISFILLFFAELLNSSGARISLFFIIFEGFFLYTLIVGKVAFKKILLGGLVLICFFSLVEKLRVDLDPSESQSLIGVAPAEFGSVFFTSFHLYEERDSNNLPSKDIQMFFFDFISPFMLNSSIDKFSPMFWYRDNYFPDSDIPPFTMGPIANSAIWFGIRGLIVRAFINGLIFAFLINFFVKKKHNIYILTSMSFIYATSIMILKYSIFFHLTPVFKDLLPLFLIVFLLINIERNWNKNLE